MLALLRCISLITLLASNAFAAMYTSGPLKSTNDASDAILGAVLDDLMPHYRMKLLLTLLDLDALVGEPLTSYSSVCEKACAEREIAAACTSRACTCSTELLVDIGLCTHCVLDSVSSPVFNVEVDSVLDDVLDECNASDLRIVLDKVKAHIH